MKNTSKLIALLLVVAMMTTVLAGCGKKIDVDQYSAPAATQAPAAAPAEAPAEAAPAEAAAPAELTYADGTTLRMATGYNSTKTLSSPMPTVPRCAWPPATTPPRPA